MRTVDEDGFSLIELLVVVIIIGILAAIAIPRFLEQRERAFDSTAIADLRNLVAIQTSVEASTGLTEDALELAAEGWEASDDEVVACADVLGGGDDVVLAVWHERGSTVYSWQRTDARLVSTPFTLPTTCVEQLGGSPTQVDL